MDVTIGKEKTSLPCHFRILITGATGFVGGALYTALQHRGDDVLGMARRTDRHSFLRDAASLHSLHGGDILDAARLAELMQGVDVVIHSAAALSGSYATQFRANVMGTQNVLQVAARAGVRHVIHISTIAVFGYDWPELIDEKTPLSPSHEAYSLSKAKAERAVHAFPQQHDLPVTIVRLGGVYGPGSDLWTETFFRLAASRYAALPGAGRGTAPLVFIDDLVDLLLRAIDHSTQVAESAIGPLHAVMTPAPTWHEFLGAYRAQATDRALGHVPASVTSLLLRPVLDLAARLAPAYSQTSTADKLLDILTRPTVFTSANAKRQLGWQANTPLAQGAAIALAPLLTSN